MDYKSMWQATKLDLKDQIDYSVRLQDDIEDLQKKLHETKNSLSMRERVASEVHRQGYWDTAVADKMMEWITGVKKSKAGVGVQSVTELLKTSASKTRRKYTKKSKRKGKRGPKLGVKRGPYKKKK